MIFEKTKLIRAMEEYFGKDTKRINHAKSVLNYAEGLLITEKADKGVVITAALFHDIGIRLAEKKYGSSAGHYQEIEGPPIARRILKKLGLKEKIIEEVCNIIASHHSPGEIDTLNFKVLYDADWLVNLKDEADTKEKTKLSKLIEKVFLTATGKALAKKIYLA
jgi:HD superfamily phosphohydrolase YqeK